MNTTKHQGRTCARAAAAGLLAALTLPVLAGTAHADGGTQPRHLALGGPAPASAEPTPVPSTVPRRPAPAKPSSSSPGRQPSTVPSASPGTPEPSAPPTANPGEARPSAPPSAAPSSSTPPDELAHTGSSKTNTALGAGAAALIAAGAGTVYAVRRRQNH